MKKKPILLNIIRWIVGLVFIFSGLVKANDPMGFSYKMLEFFEAWGWTIFNDYALALAILMNIFEILAGVALILGWRMKLFSWLLLLLIIFFTFLTGYVLLSGKIKACGCFGDCIPLLPMQTFMKDIALLLLILILFFNSKKLKPLFKSNAASVIILLIVIAGSAYFQSYVLKHLPVVDCLPYKKGNNLLKEMQPPPGSVTDSFAYVFTFKKDGKIVELDLEQVMEVDSTYEPIDRVKKLVRKGNATPAITDFALLTPDGNDTTQAVLNNEGWYVLTFIKEFNDWDKKTAASFEQVLRFGREKNIPVMVVTATPGKALEILGPDKIILACDATVVKTAARVVPTYFLMQAANIKEKKSYKDVNSFLKSITVAK